MTVKELRNTLETIPDTYDVTIEIPKEISTGAIEIEIDNECKAFRIIGESYEQAIQN